MIDKNGKVLYVGKAKNIKKRIVAYSHLDKLPLRLQKMVSEIDTMQFIVVKDEARALLTENDLIKKFEPKYNILLKDDKSFPYLSFSPKDKFPTLQKFRGKPRANCKYFGPFASVGALNQTIDILQKAFLLRSCKDSVFKNRSKPCLMYQIKRCSAPCTNCISEEEYKNLLNSALDFLSGKNLELQQNLSKQMQTASDNLQYEKAAVLRDRIKALSTIQA